MSRAMKAGRGHRFAALGPDGRPKDPPDRLREVLLRMPGRRPPVVFRADGIWERSIFTTTTNEQVY